MGRMLVELNRVTVAVEFELSQLTYSFGVFSNHLSCTATSEYLSSGNQYPHRSSVPNVDNAHLYQADSGV